MTLFITISVYQPQTARNFAFVRWGCRCYLFYTFHVQLHRTCIQIVYANILFLLGHTNSFTPTINGLTKMFGCFTILIATYPKLKSSISLTTASRIIISGDLLPLLFRSAKDKLNQWKIKVQSMKVMDLFPFLSFFFQTSLHKLPFCISFLANIGFSF